MGRIEQKFLKLKETGDKALIAYLIAGDPDLQTTSELIHELERSGIDIIEIGVPFSDPTADGPVIQAASQRALKSGTNLSGILKMITSLRRTSDIPLVLFGYFNPILHYGCERFAADTKAAGVDAILIVDLPPEESNELRRFTDPLGIDLISLIAPTTDSARAAAICKTASGFIYYISITGVTGTAKPQVDLIRRDIQNIKKTTNLPIAVGFGISTPEDAAKIAPHADGIVVGSAFVRLIEQYGANKQLFGKVGAFAKSLRKAI
jgi:tryptophan synthase alpha chain